MPQISRYLLPPTHASGVAATVVGAQAGMSAADVRRVLVGRRTIIVGKKTDTGAGVIDAYDAHQSRRK